MSNCLSSSTVQCSLSLKRNMKSDNPLESLGKDAPINLPTSTEDEIVVAKVNTSALQEPAETRLENGLHEALSGKGARSHAENTGKEKGRNIVR